MRNKTVIGLLVLSLTALAPYAHAQSTVWDMADSQQYGTKLGGMLGRGLLNVGTSFLDVVVQTVEKTKDGPPLVGTLTGLGGGIGCTALRLGSGVLDVVSSWVPGFNGFAVSRSYSNCLEFEAPMKSEYMQNASSSSYAAPATSYVKPSTAQTSSSMMSESKHMSTTPKKHNPMDYVKK